MKNLEFNKIIAALLLAGIAVLYESCDIYQWRQGKVCICPFFLAVAEKLSDPTDKKVFFAFFPGLNSEKNSNPEFETRIPVGLKKVCFPGKWIPKRIAPPVLQKGDVMNLWENLNSPRTKNKKWTEF